MSGNECENGTRTSETSFVRIDDQEDNLALVEAFTVNLRPKVFIVSSSFDGYGRGDIQAASGLSGSMPIMARSSHSTIKLDLDAQQAVIDISDSYTWTREGAETWNFAIDGAFQGDPFVASSAALAKSYLVMAQLAGSASESGADGARGDLPSQSASYYLRKYMDELSYEAPDGTISTRAAPRVSVKSFQAKIFRPPVPGAATSISIGGTNEETGEDHADAVITSPFDNTYAEFTERIQPYNELPAASLGKMRMMKGIVRNNLMPHYYSRYTNSQFAYTNYNTLNFYTNGSDVSDWVTTTGGVETDHSQSMALAPTASVLIYPAFTGTWDRCVPKQNTRYGSDGRYANLTSELSTFEGQGIRSIPTAQVDSRNHEVFGGPYSPAEGFTFSFYINPRYTNKRGSDFRAGTILHMSSTYAVSLVTGSSRDHNGQASVRKQHRHISFLICSNSFFK